MKRRYPGRRAERGVTLVELLAALVISAFIVVMASRIYLGGHFQFLRRIWEAERLETRYRLKGMLQGALKEEVARCTGGKLWLRGTGPEKEMDGLLRVRFPEYSVATFLCLEPAPDSASLVEWKGRFQPKLVEYQVVLKSHGAADTLVGSCIK